MRNENGSSNKPKVKRRIRQLMDELRPEFLVPVRSSMPTTLDETINRLKAVSNAFGC
ncbi:7884_t:CDS:2 [Entrophospora sp. SA101]|nr:7884_t:CDS:2 [Entrophospora sp. SA101]